jgi:AcrR family transcriptional regulator
MNQTPSRTKQDVVTEFRCAEIVAAARKVFSKKDFRDATMEEIAEASGLAKGTIYQYFPSKQEVFLAAVREGIKELVQSTRERVDKAAGAYAKVEAFVRTRVEYLEQNRDFFNAYQAWFGAITHPASLNSELRELYQQQLEYMSAILQEAKSRGEIKITSVETAASTMYEATRGLLLRRVLGWSKASVDEDVSALTEILWKGIGAQ